MQDRANFWRWELEVITTYNIKRTETIPVPAHFHIFSFFCLCSVVFKADCMSMGGAVCSSQGNHIPLRNMVPLRPATIITCSSPRRGRKPLEAPWWVHFYAGYHSCCNSMCTIEISCLEGCFWVHPFLSYSSYIPSFLPPSLLQCSLSLEGGAEI